MPVSSDQVANEMGSRAAELSGYEEALEWAGAEVTRLRALTGHRPTASQVSRSLRFRCLALATGGELSVAERSRRAGIGHFIELLRDWNVDAVEALQRLVRYVATDVRPWASVSPEDLWALDRLSLRAGPPKFVRLA